MLEKKLTQLRKWFTEKAQLIHLHFKNQGHKNKLVCRLGDIYFAKLGVNIGHEIDKQRPVLIFQGNDWYLKRSDMVFVFPITSNAKNKKYQISFSEENIKTGSVCSGNILLQQARSISKFRLGRRIGVMKVEKLQEVQQRFNNLLYKKTPLQSNGEQGDISDS